MPRNKLEVNISKDIILITNLDVWMLTGDIKKSDIVYIRSLLFKKRIPVTVDSP